jgi:ankyrin repeat protein
LFVQRTLDKLYSLILLSLPLQFLQVVLPCPIHGRDESNSLLSLAVMFGDADAVDVLLSMGAFVDHGRPDEMRTPLLEAVGARQPRMVRALLQAGADVRAATSEGSTALHILLQKSTLKPPTVVLPFGKPVPTLEKWQSLGSEILLLLCTAARVPPINALDSAGWTPLHMAADSGDATAVRALLEAGADPMSVAGISFRPLAIAEMKRHTDAARLLRAAMAEAPNAKEVTR